MARIAMLALKNFPFGGHNVRKGREFNAPSNMAARFLIEAKLADFAPAVPEPEPTAAPAAAPAAAVEVPIAAPVADLSPAQVAAIIELSRDLLAESETLQPAEQPAEQPTQAPAESAPPEPVKQRRTYRRRDMTAEGNEG